MAKLLIVDDEKNIRSHLATFFESAGHHVKTAENGQQALALLAVDSGFDLMLTDYRMAEMNGLELLQETRREAPNLAVILMTAYATVENAVAVMNSFALQADQKGVALQSAIADSTPTVLADPVKLSWVMSNLIGNAMRYTPSGGTITVSSAADGHTVRVQVSDTGTGVAPEIRDHLFERYTQWSANGSEPGSAGLGLAIAKEIVEAHGGRIFVDSTVGLGTCFTVELPMHRGESWQNS